MKLPPVKLEWRYFALVCSVLLINFSHAQNYTIPETINYINNILDSDTKIEFSNNKFIIKNYEWVDYRTKESKRWYPEGEIHLSDISRVTVGEPSSWSGSKGCYTCVSFYCKYGGDCAKAIVGRRDHVMVSDLRWDIGNSSDAERIANALRYIIERSSESKVNEDPFSAYSKETRDYRTVNIHDLKIGMTKQTVFNTLNHQPVVDSKERGYEVYKVSIPNSYDYYFLYFSNNRLERVDKGESPYDAIIIIDRY